MPQIKTEVARRIAQVHDGITVEKAKELYAHVVELIGDIAKDKTVVLPGIGSLKVVEVDKRTHRNPQTGEPVVVPAHRKYKLKGSKL